jgi:hypothetical protein
MSFYFYHEFVIFYRFVALDHVLVLANYLHLCPVMKVVLFLRHIQRPVGRYKRLKYI